MESTSVFSRAYFSLLVFSAVLLLVSFWVMNMVSFYNDVSLVHTPVQDTLFSVIPRIDVSILYYLGVWIPFVVLLFAAFRFPHTIPLLILGYSFLSFMRALCISVTHIGLSPDHIIPLWEFASGVTFFHNDLFFSGHTAFPFFASLMFWRTKILRYFFLITSLVMAFTVLSMRIHYTVDIVGAYFISYGVFHFSIFAHHHLSSFLVRYHAEKKKNIAAKK